MRIRCAAAVLATALALALPPRAAVAEDLDIDLGPESVLTTTGTAPAIAFDGETYVAVWADNRNASTTGWDIYATRISADGTVLDPGGIPIAAGSWGQTNPRIASNGEDFLVTWESYGLGLAGARVRVTDLALQVGPRTFLAGEIGQHAVGHLGMDYVVARIAEPLETFGGGDSPPPLLVDLYSGNDLERLKTIAFDEPSGDTPDPRILQITSRAGSFAISFRSNDQGRVAIIDSFMELVKSTVVPGFAAPPMTTSPNGYLQVRGTRENGIADALEVSRLYADGGALPRPEGADSNPLHSETEYRIARPGANARPVAATDGVTALVLVNVAGVIEYEPGNTAVLDAHEAGIAAVRIRADGSAIGDTRRNAQWIARGGNSPAIAGGTAGRMQTAYSRAGVLRTRMVGTGDGVPDSMDNCAGIGNADQADADADGIGDACEDQDEDGIEDPADNCPLFANGSQADLDGDGRGNFCDLFRDGDEDGVLDQHDNCRIVFNPGQEDDNVNGTGNLCDPDLDDDSIPNEHDLCPNIYDPDQANLDGDALGDVCDADDDNDGQADQLDNCATTANADQLDANADGIGDACQALTIDEPRKKSSGCAIAETKSSDRGNAGQLVAILMLAVMVVLRRRVPLVRIAGATVVTTALALLPRAAVAEDLDIDLGPERVVLASGAMNPAVAFDGEVYVAVWQDTRNASATGTDIYATRIAVDGTVLDPSGVSITTAAGNQTAPKIASNGNDFFVIWAEGTSLAGRRVAISGSALAVGPVLVVPGETNQRLHLVGTTGNNYVVIRAKRYDQCSWDGVCNPAFHADIFRGSDHQNLYSKRFYGASFEWEEMEAFGVASGGPRFAVSYGTSEQGRIAVLGEDGSQIADLKNGSGPGVALSSASADEFLIWREGYHPADGLTVARLSTTGALLDRPSGSPPLDPLTDYFATRIPRVGRASATFDGVTSLLVMPIAALGSGGERGVVGARLRNDGSVVGPPKRNAQWIGLGGTGPVVVSGPQAETLVVYRRDDALLARVVRTGDGIPDESDNCVGIGNANQADIDSDGIGDACEDQDEDGISDPLDNCPLFANETQADGDADGRGDRCDVHLDRDQDEYPDAADNCPSLFNPNQRDANYDGLGDACDGDVDDDQIPDAEDHCPGLQNRDNGDRDGDGVGDMCDADLDGDGLDYIVDNCLYAFNPDQANLDGDIEGDACDPDDDQDGRADQFDNCPRIANFDQLDANEDGIGDACQTLTAAKRGGCAIAEIHGADRGGAARFVAMLSLALIVILRRRRVSRTAPVAVLAAALAMLPRAANAEDLDIDVGPERVLLASGAVDPRIAFDGEVYVLVWQDERNVATTGTDIYAARIAADGTILDPGGIAVTTAAGNQVAPRIASNGDDFLVVWHETGTLTAARVRAGAAGITVGPLIAMPGSANAGAYDVGGLGADYIVSRTGPVNWCDDVGCFEATLRVEIFRGSDMQFLMGRNVWYGSSRYGTKTAAFDSVGSQRITSRADGALISFSTINDADLVVVVTAAGTSVGGFDDLPGPGAAAKGDGYLVVGRRYGEDGLVTRRVAASGLVQPRPDDAVVTPLLQTTDAWGIRMAALGAPVMATDGVTTLVVMTAVAVDGGETGVVATRLRQDGNPARGVNGSAQWIARDALVPAIVAGASGKSLVTYFNDGGLLARVVSTGDGVADDLDNCVGLGNTDQQDTDADGIGDACEDQDEDGIGDDADNCPLYPNASQTDADADGRGDRCDRFADRDEDGKLDDVDNCPDVFNRFQEDADGDGIGNVCDEFVEIPNDALDPDADGVDYPADNCVSISNSDQANSDGDAWGDVCDNDVDGDGIANLQDNCPMVPNYYQVDLNQDDIGDDCQALASDEPVRKRGGCAISAPGVDTDRGNPTQLVAMLSLAAMTVVAARRRVDRSAPSP